MADKSDLTGNYYEKNQKVRIIIRNIIWKSIIDGKIINIEKLTYEIIQNYPVPKKIVSDVINYMELNNEIIVDRDKGVISSVS